LKKVQYLSPRALVVDSIQTVYLQGIMGSPGGIIQVRENLSYDHRQIKSLIFNKSMNKTGLVALPTVKNA
jgi:DNA repair protein RadA/Sms